MRTRRTVRRHPARLPTPSTGNEERHNDEGAAMAEATTYKIVEVAGTSTESIAEAMRSGVKRAGETLRNLDWVEVSSIRGHVEGNEIAHFQVEMKIGFRLE
jgi:flavin-binding protein dodecin